MAELDTILGEVEAGGVGLEQSIAEYARGGFLVKHRRSIPAKAEKQIELLSKSPDGGIAGEPLENEAAADQ